MKHYTFNISIEADGKTKLDAWHKAVEAFFLNPEGPPELEDNECELEEWYSIES